MRKNICFLLACIMAVLMTACGSREYANVSGQNTAENTISGIPANNNEKDKPTDAVQEMLKECEDWYLYNVSMENASEEQKQQLHAINENLYFGHYASEYIREIKRIMHLIPEDAPYISLETAGSVVQKLKEEGSLDHFPDNIYKVRDEFNQYAYAPDVEGELGESTIILYSVDAEHTGFIELNSLLGIRYYNEKDGSEQFLFLTEENTEPETLKRKKLEECDDSYIFDLSMALATEDQKQQLRAINDNLYFEGYEKEYIREIKRIMGLIPEDAPYLTLEAAQSLIREMKEEGVLEEYFYHDFFRIRDRFNEIAYAPDIDGGSGFSIVQYSINEDHTGFIEIHEAMGIRYYNYEDNTEIVLFQPGVTE